MSNKVITIIGITTILLIVSILPSIPANSETNYLDEYDKELELFGPISKNANDFNKFNSTTIKSVNEHNANSILVIDSDTVTQSTLSKSITDLINDGNKTVIIKPTDDCRATLSEQLQFFVDDENSDLIAFESLDNNTKITYSVGGFESIEESIIELYELMDSSGDSASLTGITDSYISTYTYNCGSFGKITGRTFYHKIAGTSSTYDFYLVHYAIQGICNDGYSKSLLGVSSDLHAAEPLVQGQMLIDYQPTTSSGTTTISFGAGVGAGIDTNLTGSATATFSASWSHSYSDVDTIDDSDFDYDYFKISYDIDECTNSGYHTLKIEPGLVVATLQNEGAYLASETYFGTFCNVVIHGYWHNNFTNFSFDKTVTIS